MKPNREKHPGMRLRHAGLTLVELLVALTIGLFLTLGLMVMMSDSSRTFKIQDEYARMQENAVASLRYISESLRHAGFLGLASDAWDLQPYGTIGAITNDCGNTLANAVSIFGYHAETQSSIATTLPCIRAENFREPSQVMVVRAGTGFPVPDPNGDGNLTDGIVTVPNFGTTIFLQSDANDGRLFLGADYANMRAAIQHKSVVSGADAPIFPYQVHVYYIRPCSRPTGGGNTCLATDDGGQPIPTLVRQELDRTTMVERPLAEGVERMVILYGVDLTTPITDGIPDRYTTDPLSLSPDGWSRVVTVRVTLLVRSTTMIAGYNDSDKQYDLNGDGTPDFRCTDAAAGAQACSYKRALFSNVIQVRNLAVRAGA